MEKIIDFINSIEEELIEIRRDLHRHPELGFAEYRTSRKVKNFLKGLDLEVEQLAKTGVVATLEAGAGPTIALRADMDALPITEDTKVDYKSEKEGVMHACGHDGHTAILLATAKVLAKFQEQLAGTIKFIFQPAEEGPGGAELLIEAGVLEEPEVDNIFGLHINNQLPTGTLGVKKGVTSAAADGLNLTILGESGHASTPQRGIDAIFTAGQVVTTIQAVISRQIDPHQTAVINLGTIEGGYRRNVIADKVEITGTVRTTDPTLRAEMPQKIERIIKGITAAQGADYKLDYQFGYPVLINDRDLVTEIVPQLEKLNIFSKIKYLAEPSMGAEDFAYYLQEKPGVFFRLGAGGLAPDYYDAHNSKFDFDERALKLGVLLFVALTLIRVQEF
ncbi:MAG: M20 metallopeptidase family protein [Bacillota bacterium]